MINQKEFSNRRKKLLEKIGNNGIAIITAAPEARRSNDTFYPYRQQSDFYYLTGFEEPEAILILAPGLETGEYILFNRIRDRDHEIWEGVRAGQEGAVNIFGANKSFPITDIEKVLPGLLMGRENIFYTIGINSSIDSLVLNSLNTVRKNNRNGVQAPLTIVDVNHILHEMRLFKSDSEIKLMRTAAKISAKAHTKAMQVCKPGMNEYELEAEINYEFQRNNARFPAYTSIVGSGRNSCILHYVNNNKIIEEHDLVLVDAGCEYQNYASDITRTFPANGKFSGEQRAIYEIVLSAQEAGIKAAKKDVVWTQMQTEIVKIITQGLVDLKILKGNVDTLIETESYFPFYMHKSGHWLGLDTHDVGNYKIKNQWRKLQPCMILTVEPGIYIAADNHDVDSRWHNIGVRIEDDILITETGNEILSYDAPKTINDIETLMNSK